MTYLHNTTVAKLLAHLHVITPVHIHTHTHLMLEIAGELGRPQSIDAAERICHIRSMWIGLQCFPVFLENESKYLSITSVCP